MNTILVMYTSSRFDCFWLATRCLELHTDLDRFERIYIIANDVSHFHMQLVRKFCERHPNAQMNFCTPRGLVPAVMDEMNDIMELHQSDVIVKMDEDVFVTPGWLDRLLTTHESHRNDPNVLLSATLCPISLNGKRELDPLLEREFPLVSRIVNSYRKPLAENWYYHRHIWKLTLENRLIEKYIDQLDRNYLYHDSIVINCIAFDSRLMDKVSPFPNRLSASGMACVDECAINEALHANGATCAIDARNVVHHYSHWGSETKLRKHVALADVSMHLNGEAGPDFLAYDYKEKCYSQSMFSPDNVRLELPFSVVMDLAENLENNEKELRALLLNRSVQQTASTLGISM